MASRASVKAVQETLRSRLPPSEFSRFAAQDFENLVRKRFTDVAALEEATKDMLQEPPGEALPALLIKSLLQEFNPSAVGTEVGRAALLSREAKLRVRKNTFLVLRDEKEVGGGFFYAPGKAVTALHNLKPSQRQERGWLALIAS